MTVSARARRNQTKFAFQVEFNGVAAIQFATCGPLQEQVGKIEYWEGGSRIAISIPGRYTTPDLTLERASAVGDFDLHNWFKQTYDASSNRGTDDFAQFKRDGEIALLSPAGEPERRWRLQGAWIIDFTHGAFDASVDEVNMETVVLAYDTLAIIAGSR